MSYRDTDPFRRDRESRMMAAAILTWLAVMALLLIAAPSSHAFSFGGGVSNNASNLTTGTISNSLLPSTISQTTLAASANVSSGSVTENWGACANLTGADTVTFSDASARKCVTLTANEANGGCTGNGAPDACCTGAGTGTCGITLSDGRTASATTDPRDQLEVCENATGSFPLGFTNSELGASGSGWSNQTQRGYTLTASRCDLYCFYWDGSSFHDCGFVANVPKL